MKNQTNKHKTIIPKATAKRLMTDAGATRVSNAALVKLVEVLEAVAYDVTERSIQIAHHAKRKTVMDSDIELATNA